VVTKKYPHHSLKSDMALQMKDGYNAALQSVDENEIAMKLLNEYIEWTNINRSPEVSFREWLHTRISARGKNG